jgi:hypothetical protein
MLPLPLLQRFLLLFQPQLRQQMLELYTKRPLIRQINAATNKLKQKITEHNGIGVRLVIDSIIEMSIILVGLVLVVALLAPNAIKSILPQAQLGLVSGGGEVVLNLIFLVAAACFVGKFTYNQGLLIIDAYRQLKVAKMDLADLVNELTLARSAAKLDITKNVEFKKNAQQAEDAANRLLSLKDELKETRLRIIENDPERIFKTVQKVDAVIESPKSDTNKAQQ